MEGFQMKIIMRRDCVIFYIENNAINNAVKAVSFELRSIFNLKRVLEVESNEKSFDYGR